MFCNVVLEFEQDSELMDFMWGFAKVCRWFSRSDFPWSLIKCALSLYIYIYIYPCIYLSIYLSLSLVFVCASVCVSRYIPVDPLYLREGQVRRDRNDVLDFATVGNRKEMRAMRRQEGEGGSAAGRGDGGGGGGAAEAESEEEADEIVLPDFSSKNRERVGCVFWNLLVLWRFLFRFSPCYRSPPAPHIFPPFLFMVVSLAISGYSHC